MIKAVIFDLDDTLYRELDFVNQSFRKVAEAMSEYLEGKQSPEELFQEMVNLMEREGRGEIFDRLCEKYGVDMPVDGLVKLYRETRPVLKLYPDGEEILEYLKEKGIKTGLITDGNSQVQHHKIEALGLDKRLDTVLVSYDIGKKKPDPEVYRYCLEKLGCEPGEAVYVGDNPLKDFIGARRLGMKTIRIIRPEGMHMRRTAQEGYEADREVHLLTEIGEWIEQA